MYADNAYHQLVNKILNEGEKRTGRNGNTTGLFGEHIKFDLRQGFPLLTTKKMFFRGVIEELVWMFIKGRTDVIWLQDRGVKIWDLWQKEDGTIGAGGYAQLTSWGESTGRADEDCYNINQIKTAAKLLKDDPNSRRNFVSAWNPGQHYDCTLPPCHISHQLYCSGDFVDMCMYQRSVDTALGLPFNMAQYALLLSLYAMEVGKLPRYLTMCLGDVHIYEGHEDGLKEQLLRPAFTSPALKIDAFTSMFNIESNQIRVEGYKSHPAIKFEVSA